MSSIYRVHWSIDIEDVDSPLKAAATALVIQRDPESTATIFEVQKAKRRYSRRDGVSYIFGDPTVVYL